MFPERNIPDHNSYRPMNSPSNYGYQSHAQSYCHQDTSSYANTNALVNGSSGYMFTEHDHNLDSYQPPNINHSANYNPDPNGQHMLQSHAPCYNNIAPEPPQQYMPCGVPQSTTSGADHSHSHRSQQSHPSMVDMNQMNHCNFGMNISTQRHPMNTNYPMNGMNAMQNNTSFYSNFGEKTMNPSDSCMMHMNNVNNMNDMKHLNHMNHTNDMNNNMNIHNMAVCHHNSDGVHNTNNLYNVNNININNNYNIDGVNSFIGATNTTGTVLQNDDLRISNNGHGNGQTMSNMVDYKCIVPSIPSVKNTNSLSLPSSTSSSTISTASEHIQNNVNNLNYNSCYFHDVKRIQNIETKINITKPHQIATTSTEDMTKKHVCSECGKRFRYLSLLDRHRTSHSSERPFPCDYPNCNKRFQHKYYLNQHKRRTHEAVKKHQCPQCSKAFVEKCNLKIHLRKHTGEKPYQCTLCFRRFSVKTNLDAHARIHNGDKPFKCGICGKCFARKAYLTQHNRTHTGEKPYQCEYCGKRCSQVGDLKKHVRIHTGEKPYQCDICHKKFRYSSHLKSHSRKLHLKKEKSIVFC